MTPELASRAALSNLREQARKVIPSSGYEVEV
jgi:hypothetical protein